MLNQRDIEISFPFTNLQLSNVMKEILVLCNQSVIAFEGRGKHHMFHTACFIGYTSARKLEVDELTGAFFA